MKHREVPAAVETQSLIPAIVRERPCRARAIKDSKPLFPTTVSNMPSVEPNTTPFLSRTLSWLSKAGSFPFVYNKKTNRLQQVEAFRWVWWTCFHATLFTANSLFIFGRTATSLLKIHSENSSEKPENRDPLILLTVFLFSLMGALNQLNCLWNGKSYLTLYNNLLQLRSTMAERQLIKFKDFKGLNFLVCICTVRAVALTASLRANPLQDQYIFSVLPRDWQTDTVRKIFTAFEIHLIFSYTSCMFYSFALIFLYIWTIKRMLQFMNTGKRFTRSQRTSYRALQVLCNHFNAYFGDWNLLGLLACLTLIDTTYIYGSVRKIGKLNAKKYSQLPAGALGSSVVMTILLPAAANIRKMSSEVIWKMQPRNNRLMKPQITTSMEELKVRVGNFGHVGTGTTLGLLQFVTVQSMNLLINW